MIHFSIFYTIVIWILGTCYGFVLLSSAAGQNGNVEIYKPGEELTILKLWLKEPKLHIKTRKAPSPDGFAYHSSKLEEFRNKPFYVHWTNGKIPKIYVNRDEPTTIVNIKRGLASLLQVQFLDGTAEEIDSSGNCQVEYISTNHQKITKTKRNCLSPDLPYLRNPQTALDAIVESSRVIEYEFNHNLQFFKTMKSNEKHVMSVSTNKDFGSQILSEQVLEFDRVTQDKFPVLTGTVDHILNNLIAAEELSEESLCTVKENVQNEEASSFFAAVDELRSQLSSELLGTTGSAKAFVKLVSLARKSNKEDIKKTLKAKKNVNILPQLFDILGSSPTLATFEAAMTELDLKNENQIDLCERYLWSLALGAYPNPEVVKNYFRHTKSPLMKFPPN
ncbi:hypothetical protein WA026_000103 [Henosepilachna vigintioctopunctata]|uniref:Vitellogenin domain-containing protein n=1 Tax=Henosepilachna vigintioctopunctata TaxID=420089 RepID=A0AAW1V2T5_9CUCU